MNRVSHKKIRRSFLRRSVHARVKVSCRKKQPNDMARDLARMALDLSETGARLLVTAPLEIGEEVILGLDDPGCPQPFQRNGSVVWSFRVNEHGYAVGVRLEDGLGGDVIDKVTIKHAQLDY
jgi:hypothetical protein